MEEEIIDGGSQTLPEEAVSELLNLSKWMSITAVISIIGNILLLLLNITQLTSGVSLGGVFSILMMLVSIFFGFLVIKNAESFKSYAEQKVETELVRAITQSKQYWMFVVLLTGLSIILSNIE